ncbi:MAG: ATP-binding protein [Clostridium sp.]|nr:MAG: ATP-binding protein [Clostridium sp.]
MLQLLIVIYNNSSVTVAIDELDSGVFEYLLGEILRIISDNGKGQLIFTSHNLRPLETLNKAFVAFTTTNPQK